MLLLGASALLLAWLRRPSDPKLLIRERVEPGETITITAKGN